MITRSLARSCFLFRRKTECVDKHCCYLGPFDFFDRSDMCCLLTFFNFVCKQLRHVAIQNIRSKVQTCFNEVAVQFNGLDWSLLVKHLEFEDIHNSWLYCFTNGLVEQYNQELCISSKSKKVPVVNLWRRLSVSYKIFVIFWQSNWSIYRLIQKLMQVSQQCL